MSFWRGKAGGRAFRIMLVALMLAVPVWHPIQHLSRIIDMLVDEFRFAGMQRPATGNLVFVALDKKSLEAVGQWPWPRSVYGDLLFRLTDAEAADIFMDIDFSTPSSAEDDLKLEKALVDAGGSVILPVFRQHDTAASNSQTSITAPLAGFAAHSWLAFANVESDPMGLITTFLTGDLLNGAYTQSAPVVLARSNLATKTAFIDFSIDPSTVPTFSASDVLDGKVQPNALRGKTVVVGAHATELKDIYSVPLYGTIAGPMIHILAAETILQDRVALVVDQTIPELGLAFLLAGMAYGLRSYRVIMVTAAATAAFMTFQAAGFGLQAYCAFVLRTGTVSILLASAYVGFLVEKIAFTRGLERVALARYRVTKSALETIVAESADAIFIFNEKLEILAENTAAEGLRATDPGTSGELPYFLRPHVIDALSSYQVQAPAPYATSIEFDVMNAGTETRLQASLTISNEERIVDGVVVENASVGSIIARDVTERRRYEQKLLHLSMYDDLTGLCNRRSFTAGLQENATPHVVAAIGLHRYAELQMAIGRRTCEALLKAAAERLLRLPGVALVGRLKEDCFAVAVACDSEERLADLIAQEFRAPFAVGGSEVFLNIRLGLFHRAETDAAEQSLEHAESALHAARVTSGADWQVYDSLTAQKQLRARELEQAMRTGLANGEFFLAYQPQVDLRSGKVCGAEALLRWKHGDLGFVSPGEFIPVAEASGFICELGTWALREACAAASTWPADMTVAVNVSPIQFAKSDVGKDVRDALAYAAFDASRLHLEITESAFLDGTERLVGVITQLQALGVSVALDDFGTGYSSLSYMSGFPLDKLKIDQSFVRKLTHDTNTLTIIRAVVSLAHGLGLKVVAEGIETEREKDMLAQMGCEEGQGYLFGRPQSEEDLLLIHAARLNERAA